MNIFRCTTFYTDDFVVNGGVSKDFFLGFLDKNAFHHLYYTETGRPDVLTVFGMIRPKLEPPHLMWTLCLNITSAIILLKIYFLEGKS